MRRTTRFVSAILLVAGIQALTARRAAAAGSDPLVLYTSIDGYPAQVEFFLAAGADPSAALQMFRAAGISSIPSDLFFTSGFVWPQFSDPGRQNDFATQSYNPSGDPTGGAALAALQRAQQTWSSVSGTTFRYAFGGTTTRCPSLSFFCPGGFKRDGHNDVGWLPLPYSGVLGITTTLFNKSTGESLEADTVLNSNPLLAWFTDGRDVDVESVILHENGHFAGLAHSPDPNAVMFARYTGVKRVLTADETDDLVFLYPTQPSVVSETPSAFNFRLLAALGDPAPGGGNYQNDFETGTVNGSGDVSFVTDVPEGEALFVTQKGTVSQVARSGQVVAGGTTLGIGSSARVAMNDTGEVAFSWVLNPLDFTGGLFRAAAGSPVQAIVLPGITPAPGGGVFYDAFGPAISNRGDIPFSGLVNTPQGQSYGIFVARQDGTIAAVVRPGDAAPGGTTFLLAAFPSIGGNGDVAFRGTVANRAGDGVYVWRAASKIIEAIAQPGDPAAGGGVFVRATIPQVNARGDVLFAGGIQQGPRLVYGLYLASRGGIVAIAKAGDVMPDGWGFGGLILGGGPSATLNDSGDVAFVTRTVQRETGFRNSAVYASSHGALRLVLRAGSVIPGVGFDVISVSPFIPAAVIDNRGDVVLQARTLFGRQVLLEAGPKAQ